jgi:hypothetical protein
MEQPHADGRRAGALILHAPPALMRTARADTEPHLALWQGSALLADGHLVNSTTVTGGVNRAFQIDWPAGQTGGTLYLTQPGYRPMILEVTVP